MRIQHNILALNAYRNYQANTSALSKNLEKLSSGYRINRAGDDAAGLAISEKMRAQITGLNAAQKNVKDGISLVKTAEGAMQEIQDMLNRMDYLATQSANGTYQDPVDRENLQKEVNALRTEINRIADSSNFNGINLLDGSLEVGKDQSVTGAGKLPAVGTTLGTDTVLHRDPTSATGGTSFSIDLHNVALKEGDTLTLNIGGTKLEYTSAAGDGDLSGEDLVDAIVGGTTKLKVDGTAVAAAGKLTINGQAFTMTKDATNGDDRITFTQDNAPTNASQEVDPSMVVTISGASTTKPSAAVKDQQTQAAGTFTAGFAATDEITIGSTKYTVETGAAGSSDFANNKISVGDLAAGTAQATFARLIATEYNKNANAEYVATANNDGTITYEAKNAGKVGGTDGPSAVPTSPTVTVNQVAGGGAYTVGAIAQGTNTGADVGDNAPTIVTGIADYNVSTTDQNKVTAAGASRLASTHFELTKDMVANGAKIKIGAGEYTFGTDVKIDDLDANSDDYLTQVAQRLTDAAAANSTYTVGHDGSRMTFTEIEDQTDCDLTTYEGVEKSFGFTPAKAVSTGLTLQIGDTSDAFNQLSVSVGDMHVSAMLGGADGKTSIADIDISTQKGAQDAVQVIKDAINYVSSVRGDLGATQNRLEHTANNLSVMAENIQDAESTIRDTDVAEEMMAYTKNNILVQAAQAMLAQANAVPQGVLQLLQ